MTHAVRTTGLTKSFGTVKALDGLDLTVEAGEVHGFLGPNGAGKSTTLRLLLGLLRADGGTTSVLGKDPWRDATEVHRRIAYVPGDVVLWPNLTGGETLDLLAKIRGGDRSARLEKDQARLVEAFDLDPTRKGRAYSKGNRQKVALIAALASGADLLLLDEPTAGLDPLMEQIFQRELAALRDEGRSVLLSSHILSEVERACAKVSIVRAGRIVESGTLEELRHLTGTRIHAELDHPPAVAEIEGWPGVSDATVVGDKVTVSVGSDHVTDLVARLGPHGVRALTVNPPTLEELFLARYQDAPA